MTMQLKPIGKINCQNGQFNIQVDEAYRAGLLEVNQFDTLQVLFWCHYMDKKEMRSMLVFDQPYKHSPEKMGVFATRSPVRPNPIALTAVSVLNVDAEAGIITIPYIDAEDGSPLLDLKPYTPSIDRVKNTQPPAWSAHWPTCVEESGEFDWAAEFVNAQ
ncbi:MAG: SAM-dependent methyltransferase [Anaerolineaceae bacterium]|nr:SAM-dependent methyltransferase [Anaerolineaceae bacterium]